jgi:hypothetical protein
MRDEPQQKKAHTRFSICLGKPAAPQLSLNQYRIHWYPLAWCNRLMLVTAFRFSFRHPFPTYGRPPLLATRRWQAHCRRLASSTRAAAGSQCDSVNRVTRAWTGVGTGTATRLFAPPPPALEAGRWPRVGPFSRAGRLGPDRGEPGRVCHGLQSSITSAARFDLFSPQNHTAPLSHRNPAAGCAFTPRSRSAGSDASLHSWIIMLPPRGWVLSAMRACSQMK